MFGFKIGSIPVRVHISFLFVAAMLGASGNRDDVQMILFWVAVVFVGVLLHELGHALMGMKFGLTPQIDLQGLGGLTSWTAGTRSTISAGQRIAISVAGPMVGVVIGGATALWWMTLVDVPLRLHEELYAIVFVNLGWGILNLLPILPMDGGNVLYNVLQTTTKGHGEAPARMVSVALSVALGVASYWWTRNPIWALYPFGMFAIMNVRALQVRRAQEGPPPREEAPPRF